MFTGIVEAVGVVESIENNGSNRHFWLRCPFVHELKIDQSLAHDGVCLTVDGLGDGLYRVTAVAETLEKTNLMDWIPGKQVNLERGMILGSRIDGHLVQGHVDCTGVCLEVLDQNGSWKYSFEYPEKFRKLIIEKGSICINGTSLTAFDLKENQFSVAIIPYTYNNTNINQLQKNSKVNLEFDMVGKFIKN